MSNEVKEELIAKEENKDDEVKSQVCNRKRHLNDQKGGVTEKRPKKEKELSDVIPMGIPFKIVDGVRHLSPYWSVYRTRTKGRWIGRKLVEVFSQEFLSTNKHYAAVACKLGRISVNGKQMTDVDFVLRNGDLIEHWGHRHEHPIRDIPIRVIAETEDLLVVDKPPSMPVHACGQYAVHTVLGLLRTEHNRTGLRVLHRLDRTTSGVLMFAKNYETDLLFKETLKKGDWTKEYVCMVEGEFPEGDIVCEQPIAPLVISMGIQCVRPEGKSAKSTFRRLWTDGKRSVCSVKIETGRTHQIRVHAQYLGFPIVADQLYNSTVWGVSRGKNAQYGKSYEELCIDVKEAHKSSNWHETVDPDYPTRMEELASQKLTVEEHNMPTDTRPVIDPVCLNCNVIKKEVPEGHFQLFLHCLRYETEKWSYQTDMPVWAVEPKL